MDEDKLKEELEINLFLKSLESTQEYVKGKREKLAEKFSMRGMYHSGPHARAVIDLELEGIQIVLGSYLDTLKKIYLSIGDLEEAALREKIEKIYHARVRASKEFLSDYLPRLGSGARHISEFDSKASGILARNLREVRILVLEATLEPAPRKEKGEQYLTKLDDLSKGDITAFLDTMKVGEILGFDRSTTFNIARYLAKKGLVILRNDAGSELSITVEGIDKADELRLKERARTVDKEDLPEEIFFSAESYLDIQRALARVLRQAKKSIWICDPYMDEIIVEEVLSVNAEENKLLTTQVKTLFKQRLVAARAQYKRKIIEARVSNKFHDRFYIVDEDQVWALGTSLNKAGAKATLLIKLKSDEEKQSIMRDFNDWWASGTEI